MTNPADFLRYAERPASNCNGDPKAAMAEFEPIRKMLDDATALLADPRLVGDKRRTVEMLHARCDRVLRRVEAHRQRFTQGRLLERMRKP